MGQTRMFRDRVVSMEQTLEGGEKHLPILKEVCREALPELEYREHVLDHERDLFVMEMEGPGGVRKRICWTRMMLFDAERLPVMSADPTGSLRTRIIEFIRSQAARPEIVVTFRHLEDGWVDTPEPKREGRRRRRGGRGGRGGERGERGQGQAASGPDRRPQGGRPQPGQGGGRPQPSPGGRPQAAQGGRPQPSTQPGPRGAAAGPSGGGRGPSPARAASGGPPAPGGGEAAGGGGKRRRRFRKRRRGGGGRPAGAGPGGGSESGGGSGASGGSGAGGPRP